MADPKPDPTPSSTLGSKPSATAASPASDPPTVDPAPQVNEDSYELVKQACAMAIQDAVAYLRNTEIIANAVIGVAGHRLLNGVDDGNAAAAISAAAASVKAAAEALATVSTVSANTLSQFPHG